MENKVIIELSGSERLLVEFDDVYCEEVTIRDNAGNKVWLSHDQLKEVQKYIPKIYLDKSELIFNRHGKRCALVEFEDSEDSR